MKYSDLHDTSTTVKEFHQIIKTMISILSTFRLQEATGRLLFPCASWLTLHRYLDWKEHLCCSRSVGAILRKESTWSSYTLTYTRGIKRVNSASKTRPTKRLSFAFCGNYTISALASMRCGCRPWSKPRQRVDGPEASGHMVKEAVNKSCHFCAYAWKMHVFLVQLFHTRTSQFPSPRGGGEVVGERDWFGSLHQLNF